MLDIKEALTMAEMQDIVFNGAKFAEAAEANLDKAHAAILKMVKVIDDGKGALMVGALEAGVLRSEARSIAGDVAAASKRFYELHQKLTAIAQKHEVDIPQPMGGGNR